jgi:competence protein ComEC
MAAFCAGVIILYCGGILLPWLVYSAFLAVALLLCVLRFSPVPFCFALGYAWASLASYHHYEQILPAHLEGIPLEIHGYFCSLPYKRTHYSQIEFCALRILDPSSRTQISGQRRLFLRWSPLLDIELGQTQHVLQVKLKRPHGSLNPIGSSYEQFLFQRRIVATGVIASVKKTDALLSLSLDHRLRRYTVLLRTRLMDALDSQLLALEHAGLLKALILGDRSSISVSDARILRNTGTQHLIAISGLHVGVIMLFMFRLLPRSKIAIFLIVVAGLVYITLVGFSTSAQRAWVMCVIGLISVSGYCRPGLRYAFLFAATIVLALDPLSPLGLGFWFSFLCVALLLLLAWQGLGQRSVWSGFIVMQVVLLVGLVPLNSYLGLPFSASNGLANLVAIPWVSLVILPGTLVAAVVSLIDTSLAQVIYLVLNELVHLLISFLSSLGLIAVQLKSETRLLMMISVLMLLLGLMLLGRIRAIGLCLVLTTGLYFGLSSRLEGNDSKLIVFDAGQGLAILLQANQQFWLYDTGAAFERSSVAESIILPYLRAQNSSESVSGIVVSHGDGDHAGGIEYLLSALMPAQLWAGEADRLQTSYPVQACFQGMQWHSGQISIEVLYPKAYVADLSSNNRSCVLRVKINDRVFLLMGDLEGKGEQHFLEYYQKDITADVLIAGHHGSNNATRYALLKRVMPSVVVFSAGYRNRFGHPHPDVIERVSAFNAAVYNTAEAGAISFSIGNRGSWHVETERNSESPFWIIQ